MLKRFVRPSWTCSRCLRRQCQQQRHNSAAATSAIATSPPPTAFSLPSHVPHETNSDDRNLRQIFDSHAFWREFSQSSKRGKSAGLLQNKYLTRPEGFQQFVEVTLQKCAPIIDRVVRANSIEEFKPITRDLDRLSDLLCRVIDLADFVRATHPDQKTQIAATRAYGLMFQYMNELNTTTALNDQLKRAASIPEVWDSWNEEEQVTANILIRDFSKSAINLPQATRQRFVDLSNEIVNVGTDFVNNLAPEKEFLTFQSSEMKGLDPQVARRLTKWGTLVMKMNGMEASLALRQVEDPDVRREIYMASRTSSADNIARLEQLLKARAELAKLSGYESFAHLSLSDKMAKTPEAVNQFLQALTTDNHAKVLDELDEIREFKKSDAHSNNFPGNLNAWDRDYYTSRLLSSMHTKIKSPDFLSAYFSLGTVMQGLSRLFNRLYGIRLVPRETRPGETWNDDVRRLDVIDEKAGHIAVVYCDLFSRPGKSPNPAHFTLRCSRKISGSEIEDASRIPHPFSSPKDAATDGMASNINPDDGDLYQLPTIALICDFARSTTYSSTRDRPTLLTFREVQTLFHEMGHAVHSMLGRTQLQNVAGTRCATDFAELPSVLMEHFAADPAVLGLFARHWDTDAPLPMPALEERMRLDTRMGGAETEAQILLSCLDQAYHSSLPMLPGFNSTRTYHDVYAQCSVSEPAGTAWQGFFGHLFGYGATYYSYLFDRAIAGRVWKVVFNAGQDGGAIDRAAGEKLKQDVLRWGGGRDGWKLISKALEDPMLAEGGEDAMREVGRWGVRAEGGGIVD
ncbi:mitochondrial intermediate peptidase [Pseudovirgaria hyperparasitica]|uniref:Mitochondrial intermediate peptidase n=1 Tax=Pseudovirgaria hyperparasitica TaxID=470096 RepID=A0A6A6WFE5_9PEZI|nr:mitochondrial intermediate peptidase [Pseudovirgaria hyperparasitica]KAF2760710.1 mitochondrial intermediate peptidase [Pseudovirgaria hyperparasitica]